MKLKSFRELNVKGKTIFLRSDLNSDIVNGKVLKGQRIKESLKTISALQKMGGRVVILAHQGNPGKKDFLGLEQHAKLLGRKVKFVDDVCGKKAIDAIRELKNGQAILLDNVRKVEGELKPKKKGNLLKKNLLPLCEAYVNDAFSVCHRDHFSITGFARVKQKGVGLLLEKELVALEKINMKECLYVLGGAKGETDIKLLGRGNRVIACGLFGQACLASRGFDFGFQNKYLKDTVFTKLSYSGFLKKLRTRMKNVELPVDFAVDIGGKRKEFSLDEFPRGERIEDIGTESIERFRRIIREAKSVYVKGPAGWAEDKRFSKGTVEILKAVSRCKGFSLVGGGQLSEVIVKTRGLSEKKFGHVSLSGGAVLSFVAGEKLVGLKALGYY